MLALQRMRTLGIDVGGTSVKAALLREGRVAGLSRSSPYNKPDTAQLADAVKQAVAELTLDSRVNAVGVCLPGLYDTSQRRITKSINVPGLVGPNLDEFLELIGLPAVPPKVVTDAHAATHDFWCGSREPGRLLGIALGTGVGACVLDDGKPLHVSGNSPGHFGQIDVSLDSDAPIGPDGGRGGLEAYIGLPALRSAYGESWPERLDAVSPPIRALVRAIRIAHAIYRPDHIALLGGVGLAVHPHAQAIETAVNDHLTRIAKRPWVLSTARSPFHAACGAARLTQQSE